MTIKKEESDRFYSKLAKLAHKNKFPLKAMFELTYRCNFRCIHCYNAPEKNKKELTANQVKDILTQLRETGCWHVGFTGGEPLIRKDIFEILEFAKVSGFRISLLTNGSLIDEKAADRIARLGTSLNRVDISVLGAVQKTFEKITQKEGSYNKVLRAVELLKQRGVDAQLKLTVMRPNQAEAARIKKLAEKLGTMFRYSATVNPKTNGDQSPLKYQLDPEEAYQIKQKLAGRGEAIDEDHEKRKEWRPQMAGRKVLFKCGAGQTEVTISPYGELNLCLEIQSPRYNILKGSVRAGWEKIKKQVEAFVPSKNYQCGNCAIAAFCQWCPAKSWLGEGGLVNCNGLDREMALVEAKHSPYWKKIEPLWKRNGHKKVRI